MKSRVSLVVLAILYGVFLQAQEPDKGFLSELSVEQKATLQTKHIDLAVNLSKQQYEEVLALNINAIKNHEANAQTKNQKKQLSAEERYELMLQRLEKRKAYQLAMREILDNGQYEVWQKLEHKKRHGAPKMPKNIERKG